jgi:hypothetical protein
MRLAVMVGEVMTHEEAMNIILAAAARLARYCEKGSVINFDNDYDEAEGETIAQAIAQIESEITQ